MSILNENPAISDYPVVSVLMITYNHERYIAQSISSALMQQTDFPFEIVIGEDHSSDGTRAIVESFQQQYPDRIRAIFQRSNLGLFGKINLINTLMACRGRYIALLEGDDYWISPDKLALQVRFLEEHPECSICFHRTIVRDDKNRRNEIFPLYPLPEISKLEDILSENYMQTCSVMFRNGLISKIPDWFYSLYFSDWPLHILNAGYGDIGFIDRVMGVYRRHEGGIWTSSRGVLQYKTIINMLQNVDVHFGYQYHAVIRMHLCRMYLGMMIFCLRKGYFIEGVSSLVHAFPVPITKLVPFWFNRVWKVWQAGNIRPFLRSMFPLSFNAPSPGKEKVDL